VVAPAMMGTVGNHGIVIERIAGRGAVLAPAMWAMVYNAIHASHAMRSLRAGLSPPLPAMTAWLAAVLTAAYIPQGKEDTLRRNGKTRHGERDTESQGTASESQGTTSALSGTTSESQGTTSALPGPCPWIPNAFVGMLTLFCKGPPAPAPSR